MDLADDDACSGGENRTVGAGGGGAAGLNAAGLIGAQQAAVADRFLWRAASGHPGAGERSLAVSS